MNKVIQKLKMIYFFSFFRSQLENACFSIDSYIKNMCMDVLLACVICTMYVLGVHGS